MRLVLFAAAAALVGTPALAAAPCKDAHGKFVKCPPPKPVVARCKDARGRFIKCAPPTPAKPIRCKDAHGKYAKCGLPGTHPA